MRSKIIRLIYKIKIYIFLLFNSKDEDIKKILDFLRWNPRKLQMISYDFINKYDRNKIKIYNSPEGKYILVNEYKMFLKRGMDDVFIKDYINSLYIEQDKNSPHCYMKPLKNDIIADIGAAEGFFTLLNIDKIKKAYLFECDPLWVEALKKTFNPFKNKVIIVEKYVSNIDDKNNVKLDSYFYNKEIDYLKVDIEGSEINMLEGGKNIIPKIKRMSICVYHKYDDKEKITNFLRNFKGSISFSKGYIIPIYAIFDILNIKDKCIKPYLRKGVLYFIR